MRAKRAFDIVVGSAALVLSSPLWLIAAIAIKVSSQGPVFHSAERVGKDGVPFTLLKFRTMRVVSGPRLTTSGDPRITPVGAMLRRLKIDELPQLVNVLRGDMSLVGPRPEDPRYVAQYTDEQREVLTVRPGMTSPASLAYRDEERIMSGGDVETLYLTRILPAKLETDLAYLRARSLWVDMGVLARTAWGVFVRPRR